MSCSSEPAGPHIAISLSLCLHCLISPNRFACPSEANKDSLAGATTDRARSIRLLFGGGPQSNPAHRLNPRGPVEIRAGVHAAPAGRYTFFFLFFVARRAGRSKGRSSCWSPSPPIFASETIPSRARPRLLIANREATCGWMDEKSKSWRNRSVGRSVRLKN